MPNRSPLRGYLANFKEVQEWAAFGRLPRSGGGRGNSDERMLSRPRGRRYRIRSPLRGYVANFKEIQE